MYEILIVVYLIVAIALVGLVLIQQGKGSDLGASFGAGASATLFGSSGAGNFLTRTTTILATLFFVISIFLGRMTIEANTTEDEFADLTAPAEVTVPVEPVVIDADLPVADKPEADVPAENKTSSDVPAN